MTSSSLTYLPHEVELTARADGTLDYVSRTPIGSVVTRTTDWLDHWADAAPDRIFLAERSGEGWREMSFRETRQRARAVAAALLDRGHGPGSPPVVLLSGASLAHAVLVLATQYIGLPAVPLAEQYSLIPEARGRLDHILAKVRPDLIFAQDSERFGAGLARARELLGKVDCLTALELGELERQADERAVNTATARVGPDTVAKILFTSGSTSEPKGVITTQRMLCLNQAQIAATRPALSQQPPKIVDWLPWNHTFGSSHNFNMMLAHGGCLSIDDGRPMPGLFERTLENLRARSSTISFNVPAGFVLLADALKRDAALRRTYFQELEMIFYAGATVPADTWRALRDMAIEERGFAPLMGSGWGLTETAPAAVAVHQPVDRTGIIGVPLPETEIKLTPVSEGRFEIRVRGDIVMPGYFQDPERTAEAIDGEGYLITGDAVRFVDPDDPAAGLAFDGRLGEDFKLQTGTWVKASALRLDALGAFDGLAIDLVVTGADRHDIGVLIFTAPDRLAALGIAAEVADGALIGAALHAEIGARLDRLARGATGASNRIARALVLADPPSIEHQEVAAKGNLNIARVLEHRAALVDRLYDDRDPAVIQLARD